MSIEAIKEALAAGPTSALYTHPRDDNKWKENQAFALACNPEAIRSLIERMEAAEAENAKLREYINQAPHIAKLSKQARI